MSREQNMLLMIAAVVVAFILAGGPMLCQPRPEPAQSPWAFEDDPDYQAAVAEMEERKRRRAGKGKEEPSAPVPRMAGAYYPDQDAQQDQGGGIDPLIIAGVGGGIVFGLVGAAAFLVLGMSRKEEEPEVAEESEEEPLVSSDP